MAPVGSGGQGRGLSVIDRIGRLVAQRHMGSLLVVPGNVFGDSLLRLPHRLGFMEIDVLILEGPPESLHDDVVHGSTLAIPADGDTFGFQNSSEDIARELAALVGIENLGTTPFPYGLEKGVHAELRVQSVRHSIGQDFTAMPIQNGHQVDESPAQRDVGDIGAPNLVGTKNGQIPESIGVLFESVILSGMSRVWLRQDRHQTHFPHQSTGSLVIDQEPVFLELSCHSMNPEVRVLREDPVDSLHERNALIGFRSPLPVERRAAQSEQLALPTQGERG